MNIAKRTAVCLVAMGSIAAQALAAHAQSLPAPPDAQPSAPASSLPRPAYAIAPAADAGARAQPVESFGGPQAFDRYGGGGTHPTLQGRQDPPPARPAYNGPRLGWSSKVETAQVPARPAATYAAPPIAPAASTAVYAPAAYPAPVARGPSLTQVYSPSAPGGAAQGSAASPPPGWTFVQPIGQRPAEPAALPTSIYAPPPAQPAPMPAQAQAQAQSQTQIPAPAQSAALYTPSSARRYSVHREYGMQPDPIPLPPQFFGNTADMSKPETDDPLRRTTTPDGKSHNALQPSDGQ